MKTKGTKPIAPDTDERFRLLVDRVKDYAIFMLDPQGNVVSWNDGAQRIKGYAADEIIGRHMSTFYPPEDVGRGHPAELLAVAERDGRVEEEGWRVRKDGSRFWADVVITALRDDSGKLRGFGKVTRDLTERREQEQAIAELSGRLLQLQDDERRRIARDLHDSTSPLLTGLVAKLYAARQIARDRDDGIDRLIEDAITGVEATGTVIRSVSSALHPPLLDESGLAATLRWFAPGFAIRHEIPVDLDLPANLGRFRRDIEIALFRVVQETLTSVLKNMGASHARIRMGVKDGSLTLTITGDGSGIPPGMLAEVRAGRGDLGISIAGMRERMRKLGGTLALDSESGTVQVSATLPLPGTGERTLTRT